MALIPEQDFKLLFESAPGLYLVLLPDFTIAAASNAYLHATMTAREEITGHNLFEIFPDNPDDNEANGVLNLRASLNYVLEHKHAHTMAVQKYDIRRPDGTFEVRYWSPLNTPVLNAQNELIYIIHNVTDVTAAQNAQNNFKKIEKNFQSLVSSVKDYAIFMLDTNGNVSTWNSGAEAIKGYKAEEIIGRSMNIFYTEEELAHDEPRQNLKKALQYGHYETQGYRVRKDGSKFYADAVITPVYENGQLYGYAKVTKDITKAKKSEETIRYLATITDNIQDPVIATDNNFFITSWNEGAEKLFGWESREVLAKSAIEVLKADFPFETRKEILNEFATKGFWRGEVIYHSKTGNPIHVLATLSRLMDSEERQKGTLILARDITQRKHAEEALKKLNAELEQRVQERTEEITKTLKEKNEILESIGDAFFAVDKNWTITYWNRVAETALNINKEKAIGKNLWQIFSESIDSVSYKKYNKAVATNKVVHFEDYYPALNKWYEIGAYPSENGLSVYFKDITERKKAAEEIDKLNLALEDRVLIRTEQLKKSVDEMEAFSYSISHDLRAPLRSIIGFANILEEDYGNKLDEEAKRITSVIKKNTSRMGRLIDDLLSFSKTEKLELVKTNVNTGKVVKQAIDEVDSIEHGKKIEWILHPLSSVKADINTLTQVWVNLISNAVKYSSKKEKPKIEIGAIKEIGSITFFIKDNGVGFDEKYKNKLFNVFQRLHSQEEFEGTGIGLAIVEKIISKHGGKVWAEAELNKGATFYFSIPVNNK